MTQNNSSPSSNKDDRNDNDGKDQQDSLSSPSDQSIEIPFGLKDLRRAIDGLAWPLSTTAASSQAKENIRESTRNSAMTISELADRTIIAEHVKRYDSVRDGLDTAARTLGVRDEYSDSDSKRDN